MQQCQSLWDQLLWRGWSSPIILVFTVRTSRKTHYFNEQLSRRRTIVYCIIHSQAVGKSLRIRESTQSFCTAVILQHLSRHRISRCKSVTQVGLSALWILVAAPYFSFLAPRDGRRAGEGRVEHRTHCLRHPRRHRNLEVDLRRVRLSNAASAY